MNIDSYFETLSPGMKARLDARYRSRERHEENDCHRVVSRHGNGSLLNDAIGKIQPSLIRVIR